MSSMHPPESKPPSEFLEPVPLTQPPLSTTQPGLYTTFTTRQKHLLTLLLGFTAITSPLTATIYFPLLPLLSSHYGVSTQAINLTIAIYIIFQAISPAIFATLSDSLGRRIIFLLTLTLYVLSNLFLAVEQNSYAALLVLRALQSLGASATFAVSYGVVADLCVPAERGKMIGPVSMALNLGTCVGPVVGGWIAFKSGDYGWVFWFLFIVGAMLLVAVGAFLPETARNVVGNGSVKAGRWWERTWGSCFYDWSRRRLRTRMNIKKNRNCTRNGKDESEGEIVRGSVDKVPATATRRFRLLNPLPCLRIIFWKDAAQVLWLHGSFYMVDYSIQTSIPSSYKDIYNFNELEIGLSYLPRGAGIILGGYVNGKMMDRNYEITAKQIGRTIDRDCGDDIDHFPIEKARTRGSWYLLGILSIVLIGYGWALDQRSHVSIPLILQFVQGFLGTSIYTISNTLLVDVFPESPSTAAAAASIVRCALAALGVAIVQPLISVLGRGWYFTALSIATGSAGSVAIWTIRTWGMKWRTERVAKIARPRIDDSEEMGLRNQIRATETTSKKEHSSDVADTRVFDYDDATKN